MNHLASTTRIWNACGVLNPSCATVCAVDASHCSGRKSGKKCGPLMPVTLNPLYVEGSNQI